MMRLGKEKELGEVLAQVYHPELVSRVSLVKKPPI